MNELSLTYRWASICYILYYAKNSCYYSYACAISLNDEDQYRLKILPTNVILTFLHKNPVKEKNVETNIWNGNRPIA